MKQKENKFKRLFNWYIKGEYHCDKCPFCWGGEYCPGCDDYEDMGCYIKGEDGLDKPCRLIPPIRFLLGWGKRKKATYHMNHQYDNILSYSKKEDGNQEKFEKLLTTWLENYELHIKSIDGSPAWPIDKKLHITTESWRVRDEYENFAHPSVRITLRKQWATLIKETWKAFVGIFKPYFCK